MYICISWRKGNFGVGLSPFALALPTIISVARSKIFLFPRSIDSRHLAPIRQVVICVEGIEISIVAVRLPPGITEAGGSRLKRRRRLREKKTFIKKSEDWRAPGLYVLSLDEQQPLLSIIEHVGSGDDELPRHFVPVVDTERCGRKHRGRVPQ